MVGDDLLELAREPSAEKRSVLLHRITNLFFDGTSERNVSEHALFDEIVLHVMPTVAPKVRSAFSNQIADKTRASRKLVLALAGSEILVARPVLERSAVLTSEDLVTLARDKGDEHLQAISRRTSLDDVVTDVLIERGSAIVRHLLASNSGARFSMPGFDRLMRHAQSDETLRYDLATRTDLPVEVVARLSTILSDKLRRTLHTMGLKTADTMTPAALRQLQARLSARFSVRENEVREVETMVRDIRAGVSTADQEIAVLARADRAFDVASLVAELVNVDHATAMKSLTAASEEPLIVLFRCLDVSWETFERVLQLRAKRQNAPYVSSQQMVLTYHEMDKATAQRILRFLQIRRASSDTQAA